MKKGHQLLPCVSILLYLGSGSTIVWPGSGLRSTSPCLSDWLSYLSWSSCAQSSAVSTLTSTSRGLTPDERGSTLLPAAPSDRPEMTRRVAEVAGLSARTCSCSESREVQTRYKEMWRSWQLTATRTVLQSNCRHGLSVCWQPQVGSTEHEGCMA